MIRLYKVILTILIVFFVGMGLDAQAQQDFLVIANTDVPIEELDKSLVKRIYNGFMTQWKDGKKVKPAYTTDVVGDSFWIYMGTTKVNFNKFWTKRVFSGNGVSPIEHKSSEDLIKYVENVSGAIGIIAKSDASKVSDKCKVLQLNN